MNNLNEGEAFTVLTTPVILKNLNEGEVAKVTKLVCFEKDTNIKVTVEMTASSRCSLKVLIEDAKVGFHEEFLNQLLSHKTDQEELLDFLKETVH